MTKQAIIEGPDHLPVNKADEVVSLSVEQQNELDFNEDIQSLASGKAFDLLKDEPELYELSDVIRPYSKG